MIRWRGAHGRFDQDDFIGAYAELERRYYTGEGADFAEWGALAADWMAALNQGDFDRLSNELAWPKARLENRSRSAFPDGSIAEVCAGLEQLDAIVASVRTWNSAVCPLSPACSVSRQEREAVGEDGEVYSWARLFVGEARDGRLASVCQFELDDEEAAFSYAEERARAAASRLAVTNLAGQTWDDAYRAAQAHDADGIAVCYAESFVFDDRRRLGGNPIDDVRTAQERILAQYNQFEGRTLAVRGERLHLGWTRWSNDSGFETTYLIVHEVDDSGRFIYEGRFDEEDFEDAYRELEQRYYAGEGSEWAELGSSNTEWTIVLNQGDLDRVFTEYYAPNMRFEIRSQSAFPDRSAADLRASLEELHSWVTSMRTWHSAVQWLSPTCLIVRNEREATGQDGERYAWTKIYVTEFRHGLMRASCEFEVDD